MTSWALLLKITPECFPTGTLHTTDDKWKEFSDKITSEIKMIDKETFVYKYTGPIFSWKKKYGPHIGAP